MEITPVKQAKKSQKRTASKVSKVVKHVQHVAGQFEFEKPYSEEDYQGFIDYMANTTTLKLTWDIIKPMVYTLSLVLSFLSIPLDPLEKGVTYGSPSMFFLGAYSGGVCFTLVFKHYFPEAGVTYSDMLAIGGIGTSVYTATYVIISVYICYPYPFAIIVPCNTAVPVIIFLTISRYNSRIKDLPHYRQNIWICLKSLCAVWSLFIVYPGLIQFYFKDPDNHVLQLAITSLLFIVRRIYKKFIAQCSMGADKHAPHFAVMLINCFHTVYISITLQQGVSIGIFFIVMVIDLSGNVISFRQLKELSANIDCSMIGSTEDRSKNTITVERKLLALSENIALVEYCECLVPLAFGVIAVFFYFHPNGQYIPMFHPDFFTQAQLIQSQKSLLLYAFAEITFLLIFGRIVMGKLNIPFASQLGYILSRNTFETTVYTTTWFMFSLTGLLEQAGHDWTFKFDWDCQT